MNTKDAADSTSQSAGNTNNATANNGTASGGVQQHGIPSKVTKVKNNEKTLLLSSDDEFQ